MGLLLAHFSPLSATVPPLRRLRHYTCAVTKRKQPDLPIMEPNGMAAAAAAQTATGTGTFDAFGSNVAAFTEQDEKDELATLTIQEILDVEQDVRGQLAAAMGNLSVAGGPSTGSAPPINIQPSHSSALAPALLASSVSASASASAPHLQQQQQLSIEDMSALLLLRAELLRIPPHHKRSYAEAVQRCPEQIDQQVQLAYLRRDGYDAHAAAGRIVRYWENRLAVFGQDQCYLPMTLDGAAGDVADAMGAEGLPFSTAVLPVRDTFGRVVVYVRASPLGRTDAVGMDKMMRAFWYVLDTAASSVDGRQNGFVVVVNGMNVQRRHFCVRVFRLIRQLLWDILPTKAKCTHLCHPSKVNYYIVHPLVRTVFGRELRLRQRVHYGTVEKVLSELRQYALPPEIIPQDMGGQLQLNFEERVSETALAERREFLQSTNFLADVLSAPMPATSTSISPMGIVSARTDVAITNDSLKGPSAAKSSKSSTSGRKRRSDDSTGNISQRKTNNRKGRSGRKSDPRMQRAIQIKQNDPDISLKTALQMGGFHFHLKDPSGDEIDKNYVDDNGVSLSQHKNNLCRRLRTASLAADEANTSQGPVGSADVSGSAAHALSAATEDAATFSAAAAFSTTTVGNEIALSEEAASAFLPPPSESFAMLPPRRDSFDEAISEIPQIEVNGTYDD